MRDPMFGQGIYIISRKQNDGRFGCGVCGNGIAADVEVFVQSYDTPGGLLMVTGHMDCYRAAWQQAYDCGLLQCEAHRRHHVN